MTKLLQQCFLFFIVVVILGHNLDNSQVSVYRTIGPTLVLKTPFNRRVMSGCCPTGIPTAGGKIADNIDLYPAMVLYFRPD